MNKENPIPVAIVSIFLYAALAVTSAFYFIKFRQIKINKLSQKTTDNNGRYDEPKILFFLVLCISAVLDIPAFIGCLSIGSPRDCEWDGVSYRVFWCFHLIALCGYAFAIVTPPVLWSDIINQKDGKLWFSSFPMDYTKRFFHVMLLLYFAMECMNIISVILFFKSGSSFRETNLYYTLSMYIEACIILSICLGCLVCGMRLQYYVKTVKLHSAMELKFLFRLNVTLLIVLGCYLTRSLFIVSLASTAPQPYVDAFAASYFAFMLCTRWLPYILCSFCLIHEMRYSGAEIAARNVQTAKTSSAEQPVSTNSASDLDRESYQARHPQLNMLGLPYSSNEDSTLSLALIADQHSPCGSRYLDDSFRVLSSDSLSHFDHFGPPSFTENALHRALSLQRDEDTPNNL